MPNILVVGSANVDVIAPLKRLPAPGETLLIADVTLANGGKGANAAVAAARLGATVRFIGAVGDDAFGAAIRQGLEADGIDCGLLKTVAGGSGTAIILLDQNSGQNSILVGPAANARLSLPEDDAAFAWADALMLQLETPVEVNVEAARRARKHGVLVVLDPAPALADLPEALLQLPDVISPNETELEILTGQPVRSTAAAEAGAYALMERGAREVVVKLGEQGSLWVGRHGAEFYPAYKVQVVDTTAAGDAFTGAFTLGLAEKRERPAVMRRALAAGALACTVLGAQPSLPTSAAVTEFLSARQEM